MNAARQGVNIFGYIYVASLAVLGAWIGWMILDTQLPTEYEHRGAVIIPDPVVDGGRVTVKLRVKRNRKCPGMVVRTLRDESTERIVAIYDPVPTVFAGDIGEGISPKTFELPEGLPPKVRYQAEACFTCNLLQTFFPICTKTPDIVFNVIPRPSR